MKFILLFIFCCCVSFSASAQWYTYNPFKKHERFPLIANVTNSSVKRMPVVPVSKGRISVVNVQQGYFTLCQVEQYVMKTAQHNMRFHVYGAASYNFSDLAQMYMKQNRLAEAKWFLLQSITISRVQNDDRLTINDLINLATVKTGYGDYTQARQDLAEARQLALARGLSMDAAAVDKAARSLQDNKPNTSRTPTSYAEAAMMPSAMVNK